MRKLFSFILGVGLLTAVQAQDRDAVNLSSFFGYPLTIGKATIGNLQITENRLMPMNVEFDSLPRYQIGAIPDQTVWHEGDITVGFYVLTDTLKSTPVTLNYSMDSISMPRGKITFNDKTGRFKYFPDKFDTRSFTVTFTAESGKKIIVQDVLFTLMPAAPPEYAAFGVEPIKPPPPATDDYTIIAHTVTHNVKFNNIQRPNVYNYSISGKELVFDGAVTNKLQYLAGEDIAELNIFAEKVIIRDTVHFYQTNVTIYAKELVFEDMPNRPPAFISTAPVMWDYNANANGENGENAGDITLYIKEYKQTGPHKRFILIGGKGQNVNWTTVQTTRVPGNGGNGGTVTSTIDVSEFCDIIHGSAGIQWDSINHQIKGAGQHGNDGSFVLDTTEFTWLHPNFVSAIVKHAKDAYLNIHNGFTYDVFKEYSERINEYKTSNEWNDLDEELQMELANAENEMQSIMFRISQNLDYFSNPIGWVPMLSFEVNKSAFEQEIEKAIRVMYLSYWIKNINRINEERLDGYQQAIEMAKGDLDYSKELIDKLLLLIPQLQGEAVNLEQQIDNLIQRVEQKRASLLAQAKNNVKKRNRWNKVAGVLNIVAKVAPVCDIILPGVGTAISTVANIGSSMLSQATNSSDVYKYGDAAEDFMGVANGFLQGGFSNITTALNSINTSSLDAAYNSAKDAFNTINSSVTPLVKGVENLHKVFAQSSTPNSQVQAELNKLMAESKEYQALIEESDALNTKKEKLLQNLANTFSEVATTSVNIQNNIVAIDGLNRSMFDAHSKHDLRALQYVDDMERRAKERLLKYHYYMAKSYEYRLLQPYTTGLDLSDIMNGLIAIAEADSSKPVLDAQDFQTLKALYEDIISGVTANILDYYNSNRPSMTSAIRFSATENDKAMLNAGMGFNLNMYERGMVLPNHENARIVNFKIYDIKVRLEGDTNPSFAYFELLMEHSGRSKIRNNGEIYWFDHINNQNQNPITWGLNYDAKYKILDEQTPSASDSSLLYSILTGLGQTNNIMIFSRPGAWSDIYISKHDPPGLVNTQMIIEDLTFELQYDFTSRPPNNRNLDVYAMDVDKTMNSLSPYIEVSKTDISGRTNGRGVLYRTYYNTEEVTLTAPEEYGRYRFINWTDKNNAVVSSNLSASVRMNNDIAITANYKYMGAILKTEDTIYVSADAGIITTKVENIGSEEMEWTAASNSPWLRITSGNEGCDNGYIILEYDDNNDSISRRVGTLTVASDDAGTKTVYVIQSQKGGTIGITENNALSATATKIYPNPATDKLEIENPGTTDVLITNILGQTICQTVITDKGSISTSDWSSGVYIVMLKTATTRSVHKVVKQ